MNKEDLLRELDRVIEGGFRRGLQIRNWDALFQRRDFILNNAFTDSALETLTNALKIIERYLNEEFQDGFTFEIFFSVFMNIPMDFVIEALDE